MKTALLHCSPSSSCPSVELSSTLRHSIFTSHASDFGCSFTRVFSGIPESDKSRGQVVVPSAVTKTEEASRHAVNSTSEG